MKNSSASLFLSNLISAFAILEGHAINLRSTNLMKSKSNDTTSNDDDSNNDNINDRDCIVCPFPDMSKAFEACRVEEELQISMWGLVEGGHDYDRLNCSIQLQSADIFAKTILLEI